MDIVLKISDDYTPATMRAQFINPAGVDFEKELADSGKLTFLVDIFDPQIAEIIEMRSKVALYSIDSGEDTLLWSGYVLDPSNDVKTCTIVCGDEKDWLRNKIIFGDYDWTSTTVTDALTALVNEINGRKGANEGDLTFETDLTDVVGKEYKEGQNAFDIVQEIAQKFGAEFDVSLNKIIVKTTIGTDRTQANDDFVQLVWNNDSPNENNITNITSKRFGKQIATRLIGRGQGGAKSQVVGDTATFGSIERSESFNDGDVASQSQEYVDKHSVPQTQREFDVELSDEMAKAISVGDLVSVKIIHGSPLVDADGSLKILFKRVIFENKKPSVFVKVASEAQPIMDFKNFISKLNNSVKRLQLY